jgi:hypothetical protein
MDKKKLDTLKHFIKFCKQELNIQSLPHVSLINDRSFVEEQRSFGEYNPSANSVRVVALSRNLADICRSLAHELTHHRQWELGMIGPASGDTGSEIENDANAMAGIIMREYGKLNMNVYDLDENASLNEIHIKPENEIFSAYHGRYLFDVTKAYKLINNGKVKSLVKSFDPPLLNQFSHPEFSATDPEKVASMKLDYDRPLGILVKFSNPESQKTEWILIDGNHRVRKAAEEDQSAKLYVITDPDEVVKFMKFDPSKKHQLFPDEED